MTKNLDRATVTQCADYKMPFSHSICRLSPDCVPSKAARRVSIAPGRFGFEVAHSASLYRLAQERLGVRTREVQVLLLNHPLLLLQYLFSGEDPALLFPFAAILWAHGPSTHLCFCSAWSGEGVRSKAQSPYLAKQTEEELIRAASELRDGG